MASINSLRHTFDQVALLYNEVRPRYPDALFSSLIDVTRLQNFSRLLEIGPGTGQATKPLAKKGFDITAVELGISLAEVARKELSHYNNVQIVTGAFEEITWPARSFDLVFAATSIHWIEPTIKYSKTHTILKDGGHIAIIHTNHISDENGDNFFIASQPIYDHYDFTDKGQAPELPMKGDLKAYEIDKRLFKLVHFQLFPVVITYSANEFVKLLNTFSNHLAADRDVQSGFYNEIENLINNSFQGKIDRHFAMSLTVAEKI
jgi:SAM-dependent methyltransferase